MDSECSTVSANGVTMNEISNGLCDPIPSVRTSASDDATALSLDEHHQSECNSSLPCSSPATVTFTIDDCEQDDHTFDDCENGRPDGTATVNETDNISPVVSSPDTPNTPSAQLGLKDPVSMMYLIASCAQC